MEQKEIETLKDTVEMMLSDNWKERLIAEYHQAKIRYQRLQQERKKLYAKFTFKPPRRGLLVEYELLERQSQIMKEYLRVLQSRLKEYGVNVGTD